MVHDSGRTVFAQLMDHRNPPMSSARRRTLSQRRSSSARFLLMLGSVSRLDPFAQLHLRERLARNRRLFALGPAQALPRRVSRQSLAVHPGSDADRRTTGASTPTSRKRDRRRSSALRREPLCSDRNDGAVYALDSTTIDLASVFPWARFARTRKAAVNTHIPARRARL